MSTKKLTDGEKEFEAVCARALKVLSSNKQKDLADSLGMSSGDLANRKKRNAVPYDKLVDFAISRNVSIDWLLTGEGQMRRVQTAEADHAEREEDPGARYLDETGELTVGGLLELEKLTPEAQAYLISVSKALHEQQDVIVEVQRNAKRVSELVRARLQEMKAEAEDGKVATAKAKK